MNTQKKENVLGVGDLCYVTVANERSIATGGMVPEWVPARVMAVDHCLDGVHYTVLLSGKAVGDSVYIARWGQAPQRIARGETITLHECELFHPYTMPTKAAIYNKTALVTSNKPFNRVDVEPETTHSERPSSIRVRLPAPTGSGRIYAGLARTFSVSDVAGDRPITVVDGDGEPVIELSKHERAEIRAIAVRRNGQLIEYKWAAQKATG